MKFLKSLVLKSSHQQEGFGTTLGEQALMSSESQFIQACISNSSQTVPKKFLSTLITHSWIISVSLLGHIPQENHVYNMSLQDSTSTIAKIGSEEVLL